MSIFFRAVPFLILTFSFLAHVSAQPASIGGTVRDASGLPVAAAMVRVLERGMERGRTTSDTSGAFSIALPQACRDCMLEVTKEGFEAATIRADSSSPATITLGVGVLRESVVVTPSGREVFESNVGASITVLTTDDIDRRHALSTIDLLRSVPAVIASRPGGIGNLTSLWVRGGESTYNKVLIDGVPLNEPGGAFNFASIAPENVERIEVLRGAHSALFGSDAMASVIQLFSVQPEGGRPRVDLTVDGGTYSTTHVAAGLGARRGALDYRAFASRLDTDNRVPNNEHDMSTLSGQVGTRISGGGALRVMGRGDFGRTGVPGATAFGRPDLDAHSKHSTTDLLAKWDQPLGTTMVQQATYTFTRSRQESVNLAADPPYTPTFGDRQAPFQFSDFLYHSTSDLRRHHVNYRADVTVGNGHTLTAAFAYDGERAVLTNHLSNAAPQRPERDNTGTTVQYERVGGSLSAIAGVRFENNGSFGFYAAPRASVSWSPGATRLHASAGLGIKEPTFLQSYSPNPGFLGNPDLDPERSRGYDIGVEQRMAGNRVKADLTWFSNHFDDLISLRTIDPATFSSQYFNIGETRAEGLELTADAAVPGGLRVTGHYVLLDSKVIRSTSTSPIFAAGRALFRRPKHSGAVRGSFAKGPVTFGAGVTVVGERVDTDSASLGMTVNEGYALLDASGAVRVAPRTSIFIALENLGDNDYMDPLGFLGLGTTVRVGIRTRF